MSPLKRLYKRNTHNIIFKQLAGFGRSLNRAYENRNHDIYSNGETEVHKKLAEFDPTVIVDGGANVGNYSLMLAQQHPGATIYAFEPVRNTFEQLKSRVKRQPRIVPVNQGLFSQNCTKEINIFNSNEHASVYDIQGISYLPNEKQAITLVRGDDFADEQAIEKIDFVKLDLEGAEYDALLGFENLLGKKSVRAVQFEYGYINITVKKLLIDYHTLLGDYGYVVGKIFPKVVEFRAYQFKHEDFIGPNFVAVHRDDQELIRRLEKK